MDTGNQIFTVNMEVSMKPRSCEIELRWMFIQTPDNEGLSGSVGHLSVRCVKKSEEIEGLQVTRKTERIKSSGRENG